MGGFYGMMIRMKKLIVLLAAASLLVSLGGCRGNKKKDEDRDLRASRYTAEQLYQQANRAMQLQLWDQAILYLKNLRSQYPFGKYAEQAALDLAYAYYKSYDKDLAISTLDRFMRNYPAHPNLDFAHYLKGMVYFDSSRGLFQRINPDSAADRNQEDIQLAFLAFKDFLEKYPDSPYATDARQRMLYLKNQLANAENRVAKYYLRRGAWVGAANRAKFVVESFQGTPAVGDALAILVKAYNHLDEPQLAADARKVLALNFPQHDYLQTGKIQLKDPAMTFKNIIWPFASKD